VARSASRYRATKKNPSVSTLSMFTKKPTSIGATPSGSYFRGIARRHPRETFPNSRASPIGRFRAQTKLFPRSAFPMGLRDQIGSAIVDASPIPKVMIRRFDKIARSPVAGVVKHRVEINVFADTQLGFIVSASERTTAQGHKQQCNRTAIQEWLLIVDSHCADLGVCLALLRACPGHHQARLRETSKPHLKPEYLQ
jgi:hypothetical protein